MIGTESLVEGVFCIIDCSNNEKSYFFLEKSEDKRQETYREIRKK